MPLLPTSKLPTSIHRSSNIGHPASNIQHPISVIQHPKPMSLPIIDLAVFLIYMLGIVGFGISFSFKKRTALEYTTGGGRLPSWAIGMSIFATFVSSISFLALPGNAYATNWNGFVFSLSIPLAALIAVKYFVPLYRNLKSESAYYFLETRFGAWARIYASVCYLLTQLARMGAIMYLLALPMNALFG